MQVYMHTVNMMFPYIQATTDANLKDTHKPEHMLQPVEMNPVQQIESK